MEPDPEQSGLYLYDFPKNGEYELCFEYSEPDKNTYSYSSKCNYNYYYTVTFDSDGGSAVSAQSVKHGHTLTSIPAPNKTGYIFDGWWLLNEFENRCSTHTKFYNDTTLYAKWRAIKFTIRYVVPNGYNSTAQGAYDDSFNTVKRDDPFVTGYTFKGWYTDSSYRTEFYFTKTITGATTIYAKMDLNSYNITFNSNGGSAVSSQTVNHFAKVKEPAKPTREGYTFTGWYTNESCTDKYNFNNQVSGPLTLYAGWNINSYDVTFKCQDSNYNQQSVNYNSLAVRPADDPVVIGYAFKGWYTDTSYKTAFDFNTPIKAKTTVYAKMDLNSYTITFESNGGSTVSSQTVNHFAKVKEPSKPTREGYTFTGWYSNEACTDKYNFNNQVSGPLTLYAGWNINYYDVVFRYLNVDYTTQSIAYNTNASKPVNDPYKAGYEFRGWYTDKNHTTAFNFSAPIKAKTYVYAYMYPVGFEVEFESNGGSDVMSIPVDVDGERITKPANPTKTGHTFAGWYTDSQLNTAFNFNTIVKQNMTLYAKWNINSYSVKVHVLNKTISTQSIEYLSTAQEPNPDTEGYIFKGWYRDSSFNTSFSFDEAITANTDIYAKMERIYFDVAFESNGGSNVASQHIEYGTKVTKPANPTRTGYTFNSWCSNETLTAAYDFNTLVKAELALYAKWDINYYDVTFIVDGSQYRKDSVAYNTTVSQPDSPSKTGYTFKGWYNDASYQSAYEFSSPITQNKTIYGKYEINRYTVTFNSDGGSAVASQTVNYNSVASKPANPTKIGYTFAGWYSDSALNNLYNFANTVTKDITIYAKWNRNYYTATFIVDGSVYSTETIEHGSTVTSPSTTKTGYDFVGWYTTDSYSTMYDFNNGITSNISIYGYYRQFFMLYFNANGGRCGTSSRKVYVGSSYGSLPNASKDYNNFVGWYTSSSGGSKVSDTTVMGTNGDVTIYAQYSLKPLSDWVRANAVPSGATVVERKWTYTKRTSVNNASSKPTSNYENLVKSYVYSFELDEKWYAEFPAGFNTSNTLYTKYNVSPYQSYENDTVKQVAYNGDLSRYIYWKWDYGNIYPSIIAADILNKDISRYSGNQTDSTGTSRNFKYFSAFESTTNAYMAGNSYNCNQNMSTYNCKDANGFSTTGIQTARYFRIQMKYSYAKVYECRYSYTKIEYLEGSGYPSGEGISDVVEWVRYRAK